ncbi:MAG: hypothetical protein NTV31_11650, partial [Bacteroidia bacterium]|nr:hypothetical protein [Bacteroidia bacterium]
YIMVTSVIMLSVQSSKNDWTRNLSIRKMIIKKCLGIAMFEEENITNSQFISYPVTVRSWLD